MYTFSSKLKTLSLILMVLGVLGIGYGFFTAPKNTEDVEKILAADTHGGGHATAGHEAKTAHEAAPAQTRQPAAVSPAERLLRVSLSQKRSARSPVRWPPL